MRPALACGACVIEPPLQGDSRNVVRLMPAEFWQLPSPWSLAPADQPVCRRVRHCIKPIEIARLAHAPQI